MSSIVTRGHEHGKPMMQRTIAIIALVLAAGVGVDLGVLQWAVHGKVQSPPLTTFNGVSLVLPGLVAMVPLATLGVARMTARRACIAEVSWMSGVALLAVAMGSLVSGPIALPRLGLRALVAGVLLLAAARFLDRGAAEPRRVRRATGTVVAVELAATLVYVVSVVERYDTVGVLYFLWVAAPFLLAMAVPVLRGLDARPVGFAAAAVGGGTTLQGLVQMPATTRLLTIGVPLLVVGLGIAWMEHCGPDGTAAGPHGESFAHGV